MPVSAKQEQLQHPTESVSNSLPTISDNIATQPSPFSAFGQVHRDDVGIVKDKEATSQSPMVDTHSPKIAVVDNVQHTRNPRSQISGNGPARIGEALNEFILFLPSLSFGSTLSSSGSVEELESASEELAELFLEDELLKPLYAKAMEKVKTDRFERNFGRLLKLFAIDLQREAKGVLEASAARFVKARAKHIAYCMAKRLDPSRKGNSQRMRELIIESHARQEKVELYLRRQIQHVNSEEAPSLNEAKHPDALSYKSESGFHSEKAESELLDQSHMKNFNDVKIFISTSTASVNLRTSFRRLLFQEQGGNQNPAQPTNSVPLPLDSSGKPSMGSLVLTDTESEESNKGETMESATPAEVHPFFAPFRMLLHGFKMAAELLELLEKPLDSRFRRIRWTCVCGSRLYDDFRELAPGALDELERFLNNNDKMEQVRGRPDQSDVFTEPALDASHTLQGASSIPLVRQLAGDISTHNDQGNTGDLTTSSTQSNQSAHVPNNGHNEDQAGDNNGALPVGLRRRGPARNHTDRITDAGRDMWILPIFQYDRYGTRVRHLPVELTMSDKTLFTSIKTEYHEETSRFRRFFAMRGVKKISYVKFVHASVEPDIHKFDDWPEQKHSPPWTYKGCPAKKKHIPLVGHTYLLHLWQNPSHCDLKTYKSQQSSTLNRMLSRLGLNRNVVHTARRSSSNQVISGSESRRDVERATFGGSTSSGSHTSGTHESLGPRSSYVLLRSPKKRGEQLIANDEDPPEAWGLYFEEGFGVHHFLFILLMLYIMASLGFAIYWCERYGFVGPHSGVGAFGVVNWMIGLISLVVTVWFKWAD
ncbi:MAG: hypothetical protein Q9225_007629 [Loekoesia sp. 1 TL-2023]